VLQSQSDKCAFNSVKCSEASNTVHSQRQTSANSLSAIFLFVRTDEFEDESFTEKTAVKVPQTKSDAVAAAGEMSTAKDSRKESRKISVTATEPRKRAREEEEYVPQPVRK